VLHKILFFLERLAKTGSHFSEIALMGIFLAFQFGFSVPAMANHNLKIDPKTTWHRLQAAQDALASGYMGALAMQSQILSELGAQLAHAEMDFFKSPQNFYILLLYLVHGGNPEHVRHITENPPPAEIDRLLVDAVLAYAQSREGDFHAALGGKDIDDRTWPTALRASLYLALTPYIARKDPVLADARLDYVRLVAPGSLYEEAALRRQVKIAAILGNKAKMALLIRHYAARFPKSPYMRDFWAEVADALSLSKEMLLEDEITMLLAEMPTKLRYHTRLRLARLNLIEAKLEQANAHARAAQALASAQGFDDSLAHFYQLATLVATTKAASALEGLQAIKIESLPEQDQALAIAARNVAEAIALQPTDIDHHENIEQEQQQDQQIDNFLHPIENQLAEIDALLESGK